jgi:hypothetical protein
MYDNPFNDVDIFDSATGKWTTAILSQARSDLAATSVGSLALFAGGTGMCFLNRADVTHTAVSCMHVVRTLTFGVKG